ELSDPLASLSALPAARLLSRHWREPGFLNVDNHGWTLMRTFLVAALRPGFPLPILVAKGEQGSGKSTACRVISSLIDPRTSALRGVPREVRDLTAAARNSWLVCFDNLSKVTGESGRCPLSPGYRKWLRRPLALQRPQ